MIFRFTSINNPSLDSVSIGSTDKKTPMNENQIENFNLIDKTPNFMEHYLHHLKSNFWSLQDFMQCHLVTEWFTTVDKNNLTNPEDYYRSGRKYTYLVEPIVMDVSEWEMTKNLRYTLIDSNEKVSELMQYLKYAKLLPLEDETIQESWTGCISKILLEHLKKNQLNEHSTINEFSFGLLDISTLNPNYFNKNGLDRLTQILATEVIIPYRNYTNEVQLNDDIEKQEMYRAAYENDPENLWNND